MIDYEDSIMIVILINYVLGKHNCILGKH
jgi:hypothetical protein